MPCDLCGPNDDDTRRGAAGSRGSGRPRREFLSVDGLADACVFLPENCSGAEHANVGTGTDITVAELAAAYARSLDDAARRLGCRRAARLTSAARDP